MLQGDAINIKMNCKNLETVNEVATATLAIVSRLLERAALLHHEFVTRGIEGGQVGIGGRAGMCTPVYREFCEHLLNVFHRKRFSNA